METEKNSDYTFLFHLCDYDKHIDRSATMTVVGSTLSISIQGYGEKTAEKGEGSPIVVDFTGGKLKVYLWSDINKEDPTHIVDMEGAKEGISKKS